MNTPTIQKVIATGRLLVQLNRRQISARRGIVISGASGTGKTTALTQFGRAHELATRKRHPDDKTRIPVIYATVPPAATSRMLAVEFARFLGLEFTSRYNLTDVTNAVCSSPHTPTSTSSWSMRSTVRHEALRNPAEGGIRRRSSQ